MTKRSYTDDQKRPNTARPIASDKVHKAAVLAALGFSQNGIASALSLSRGQVRILIQLPDYQATLAVQRAAIANKIATKALADIDERISFLSDGWTKVRAELQTRNLSELTVRELYDLALALQNQYLEEVPPAARPSENFRMKVLIGVNMDKVTGRDLEERNGTANGRDGPLPATGDLSSTNGV